MSSPLKVAIVGASGTIGRLVIDQLMHDKTHFSTPLALVRANTQVNYWKEQVGINSNLIDIENDKVDKIANAIRGVDAVVFTASGGGADIERAFTVDLDGCIKVVEACEQAGVKRLVVVSAIFAEKRDFWGNMSGYREYYIAKRTADREIRNSNLDYTIVQPGWFSSRPSTGKFVPLEYIEEAFEESREIRRDDIAIFIKEALLNPKYTNRKTVPLLSGDVPLADFIRGLN